MLPVLLRTLLRIVILSGAQRSRRTSIFVVAVACSPPHPSQNCHPERSAAQSKDLHLALAACLFLSLLPCRFLSRHRPQGTNQPASPYLRMCQNKRLRSYLCFALNAENNSHPTLASAHPAERPIPPATPAPIPLLQRRRRSSCARDTRAPSPVCALELPCTTAGMSPSPAPSGRSAAPPPAPLFPP